MTEIRMQAMAARRSVLSKWDGTARLVRSIRRTCVFLFVAMGAMLLEKKIATTAILSTAMDATPRATLN